MAPFARFPVAPMEENESMWDKSDFEFEMDRLVEDIENLQRWHDEAREDETRAGLARLKSLALRLRERVNERLEMDSFPSLDEDSLPPLPPLPFNPLENMMFLSGAEQVPQELENRDCARCGGPIPLFSFLTQDVEQSEEGWCHKDCSPAIRNRWSNPSEN